MDDEARIDSTSLIYHPKRLVEWMETGDCYPLNIEIGITNLCNHNCVFCGLDWVPRTKTCLDEKILRIAFEDMNSCGVKSITFSAESEPTLHPDFAKIVGNAKKSGLDVAVASNGQAYTPKKLEDTLPYLTWMRFSVDAATPKTFGLVHGTNPSNFNRVINNIKYAVDFKKANNLAVTIGTQMVVIKDNVHEVEKLSQLMGEVGVDNLQIKPYSHHPCSNLADLSVDLSGLDLKEKLEKYGHVLFREQAIKHNQKKNYDKCLSLPFYCLIDARGNVMPCNMFYNDSEFIYGNLYETSGSFSKIWDSEKRKEIFNYIGSMKLDRCRNACVPAAKNEFLYRLKNPHPHDNFV
ncbi:MAG: radical SAM/SPASM domain-containing protein [Candidatus Nanoarchaeia archaeon]